MEKNYDIKRGNVYLANLGGEKIGSEQHGLRPIIVLQNDIGNKFSPTVIVACITSKINKKKMPTQVILGTDTGLKVESMVMTEQTLTISKERLIKYIGKASEEDMIQINKALSISLEITKYESKEVIVAKKKAQLIKDLDTFIKIWLDKNKSIDTIMDYLTDRSEILTELKQHCTSNKLNIKEFYAQQMNCTKAIG